jgi:hypothetical protein
MGAPTGLTVLLAGGDLPIKNLSSVIARVANHCTEGAQICNNLQDGCWQLREHASGGMLCGADVFLAFTNHSINYRFLAR